MGVVSFLLFCVFVNMEEGIVGKAAINDFRLAVDGQATVQVRVVRWFPY